MQKHSTIMRHSELHPAEQVTVFFAEGGSKKESPKRMYQMEESRFHA
jgi:hypothetical protein